MKNSLCLCVCVCVCRVRSHKQKFAMTDQRKEMNRMGFNSMADEYSDTAMGRDFGMLGAARHVSLSNQTTWEMERWSHCFEQGERKVGIME